MKLTFFSLSLPYLQDMDLLAENRSLIHTGKFLRQPDTGFEWSGWSELFVLLFDNYCKSWCERRYSGLAALFSDCDAIPVVMTKPKEKDGVTKYHVNGRVCLFPTRSLSLTSVSSPSPWIY